MTDEQQQRARLEATLAQHGMLDIADRLCLLRATVAVAAERERCLEMVADEQLYPSDKDCRAVNPAIQRAMSRIESGTTLDDLRASMIRG